MKLTQIEKLSLSIDDPLIFKGYPSLRELDMKVYQVLDVTEYHFIIDGILDLLKNNKVRTFTCHVTALTNYFLF